SFTLPAAGAVTLATSSGGRVYYGSVVAASPNAAASIPVVRQTSVTDLAALAGTLVVPGLGILVIPTTPGATLDTIGGSMPYYETSVPGQLGLTPPTGPNGVAVYFQLLGAVSTKVRAPDAGTRTVSTTVVGDAITWVDAH